MLFRNEESSLRLDIVNYEFPPDGGDPTSDDRNWLVLRATWNKEDGDVVKDSNSCLLTHELQSMSAGLKVLKAGIRDVTFRRTFISPSAPGHWETGLLKWWCPSICPTPWTGTTPLRSPAPWTRRRWRR